MKKQHLFLAFVTGILVFTSCGGGQKTAQTGDAQAVDSTKVALATTFVIDTAASSVGWEGGEGFAKLVKTHNGTFGVSEGTLSAKDSALVGGKFVLDLNKLVVLDLPKGKKNADLVGHLKGNDFFDVAKFPTATFELVSAEKTVSDSVKITGNLTMKGVTKSVVFPAKVAISDSQISANAQFYINRKDWGMNYSSESSLGDEMIRDAVGIELKIVAKK